MIIIHLKLLYCENIILFTNWTHFVLAKGTIDKPRKQKSYRKKKYSTKKYK